MNLLDAPLMQRGTWQNTGRDVAPFLPLAAEFCALTIVLSAAFARRAGALRDQELRGVLRLVTDLEQEDNQ